MRLDQKGLAPIFVVIGVLVVTAIAGVYWFGTQKASVIQPPTPSVIQVTSQPSPTPDETANWKTYKNTKYRYSIKYPSDYGTSPEDQDEALFAPRKSEGAPIGISVSSKKLLEQLNEREKELREAGYSVQIEDYQVNNISGKKLIFNKGSQGGFDFFAEKNGYSYHLSGGSGKFLSIFNLMLSTFRFD